MAVSPEPPCLSPESELEARYDGRIPRAAMAAAQAESGSAPPRRRPRETSRGAVRAAGAARDCLSRMARAIAATAEARGRVGREDLLRAGFSAAEIDRHAAAATALAAGRMGPDRVCRLAEEGA
ncbi:MAG TPA: hypothetical protein VEB20_21110 [Azospirillaceae bacterium]|nr:hypothetical protein [Azospirillaceae bacterium]